MASLSVHLNEIPQEGLHLACEVGQADLELGKGDPQIQGALKVTADIVKTGTGARARGRLEGTLVHECVRCLGDYENFVKIPFLAHYHSRDPEFRRSNKGSDQDNEVSDIDEAEGYTIIANRVNLAEMLHEQVILAVPMQTLCSLECRGLCQVCGQDLNRGSCHCRGAQVESPFSILLKAVGTPPKA